MRAQLLRLNCFILPTLRRFLFSSFVVWLYRCRAIAIGILILLLFVFCRWFFDLKYFYAARCCIVLTLRRLIGGLICYLACIFIACFQILITRRHVSIIEFNLSELLDVASVITTMRNLKTFLLKLNYVLFAYTQVYLVDLLLQFIVKWVWILFLFQLCFGRLRVELYSLVDPWIFQRGGLIIHIPHLVLKFLHLLLPFFFFVLHLLHDLWQRRLSLSERVPEIIDLFLQALVLLDHLRKVLAKVAILLLEAL